MIEIVRKVLRLNQEVDFSHHVVDLEIVEKYRMPDFANVQTSRNFIPSKPYDNLPFYFKKVWLEVAKKLTKTGYKFYARNSSGLNVEFQVLSEENLLQVMNDVK